MAARTIPEPTNTDFSVALVGLMNQAHYRGIDTTNVSISTFINHQAEVIAQLNAEIRWLRNIIHKE